VVDMEDGESECKDFIVEVNGEKLIDVIKILPPALPNDRKIIYENLGDGLVKISAEKHSIHGGVPPKPIIIKRFIEVNENLFQLLGLWFGDGIKKQGERNTFGFSNAEMSLHNKFLELSNEVFGLERSQFKCVIQLPKEHFKCEELIRKEVSETLQIPLENFWKSKISLVRNTIGIDIRNDSRIWGILLPSLFEKVKDIMFRNKAFAAATLQGIIASEANVYVRKCGRLGEILIAAKGEEKRNFIRRLLVTLEILPSKDKTIDNQESILIHGLSNFKKVKEWNLVSLHPKKLSDFERGMKGFKKEEFKKGEGKFLTLKLLAESGPKRAIEITKILNRSFFTVINASLLQLERMNLVKRKRCGRKVFWEITDKGMEILKCKNSLEILRNNSNRNTS
jgi:DNA-binding HxlR family transcriptional regulator